MEGNGIINEELSGAHSAALFGPGLATHAAFGSVAHAVQIAHSATAVRGGNGFMPNYMPNIPPGQLGVGPSAPGLYKLEQAQGLQGCVMGDRGSLMPLPAQRLSRKLEATHTQRAQHAHQAQHEHRPQRQPGQQEMRGLQFTPVRKPGSCLEDTPLGGHGLWQGMEFGALPGIKFQEVASQPIQTADWILQQGQRLQQLSPHAQYFRDISIDAEMVPMQQDPRPLLAPGKALCACLELRIPRATRTAYKGLA